MRLLIRAFFSVYPGKLAQVLARFFEFQHFQIEFLDFQEKFLLAQIEILHFLNWFFMTLMYKNVVLKRFSAGFTKID